MKSKSRRAVLAALRAAHRERPSDPVLAREWQAVLRDETLPAAEAFVTEVVASLARHRRGPADDILSQFVNAYRRAMNIAYAGMVVAASRETEAEQTAELTAAMRRARETLRFFRPPVVSEADGSGGVM